MEHRFLCIKCKERSIHCTSALMFVLFILRLSRNAIELKTVSSRKTGGHFACACVNPLNDNSVGASNLMAGNRKLARKVTVLLKAISLVLWIPYFRTKNILHDKNRTFSTRIFTCRFFSSRFSWPLKTFKTQRQKSCSCISLIFTGKAMHFYGLISKLVVLLIREEMHRSNVQLL